MTVAPKRMYVWYNRSNFQAIAGASNLDERTYFIRLMARYIGHRHFLYNHHFDSDRYAARFFKAAAQPTQDRVFLHHAVADYPDRSIRPVSGLRVHPDAERLGNLYRASAQGRLLFARQYGNIPAL